MNDNPADGIDELAAGLVAKLSALRRAKVTASEAERRDAFRMTLDDELASLPADGADRVVERVRELLVAESRSRDERAAKLETQVEQLEARLAKQGEERERLLEENASLQSRPGPAGVPGPELVRRDQMVLLAKLETTYNMGELDKAYFTDIIANFEALKKVIQGIPPCPERGPSLTDVEAQLVEFAKRAKTAGLNRTNFLTLCALRSALNVGTGEEIAGPATPADVVPESQQGETQVEDDKVIEQSLVNTGQALPQQQSETKPRGDGPIEESGSSNPDGDFQNEPPDQVNQQANAIK